MCYSAESMLNAGQDNSSSAIILYNSGIECDPRLFLMYIYTCINSLISIEYVCVTCCARLGECWRPAAGV